MVNYSPDNFTRIFWCCPVIVKYCEEVIYIVNAIAKLTLVPNMSLCLLVLVDELVPMVTEWIMLILRLFYAHKAIMMS